MHFAMATALRIAYCLKFTPSRLLQSNTVIGHNIINDLNKDSQCIVQLKVLM